VPHLIILMDSIPYQAVVDRYAAGDFAWFDPPQKVIPPFPSLSEQIFSRILQCPPLPGVIDNAYDPERAEVSSGVWKRVNGYHQPWEFRCHYSAKYWEGGLAYVQPRPWYQVELMRCKEALNNSPDRVTIVYLVSASGMVCKLGEAGVRESLDEIQRLCLELLYERHGALKISICADHGHNLMKSVNISDALAQTLREAGFHPTERLRRADDVVINLDGLITYVGLHTTQPAAVTTAALRRPEIELASYLQQDRVVVRDHNGSASIEYRNGGFRYTIIDHDVLGYAPIVSGLRAAGKLSEDGFAADSDWFSATIDQQFPDAPRRLWDAFHEMVIHPPDVMLTIRDGFCCGTPTLEHFITMASTHGGLNQLNSATFLLSMTGRVRVPLRSKDIIPTIEPGYVIPVRPKQ